MSHCLDPMDGKCLGGEYKLYYDGEYTLAIGHIDNRIFIDETVLNYAFDSTFIIASQRPWVDSVIHNRYTLTYRELKRAFEESTFKHYWIIDKTKRCEYIGSTKESGNYFVTPPLTSTLLQCLWSFQMGGVLV